MLLKTHISETIDDRRVDTNTNTQIHKYMHNTTCTWLDIDIGYNYRKGFACMTLKDAQIHTLSSIMHSLSRAYLQNCLNENSHTCQ